MTHGITQNDHVLTHGKHDFANDDWEIMWKPKVTLSTIHIDSIIVSSFTLIQYSMK